VIADAGTHGEPLNEVVVADVTELWSDLKSSILQEELLLDDLDDAPLLALRDFEGFLLFLFFLRGVALCARTLRVILALLLPVIILTVSGRFHLRFSVMVCQRAPRQEEGQKGEDLDGL
jgi:hypothetical protein